MRLGAVCGRADDGGRAMGFWRSVSDRCKIACRWCVCEGGGGACVCVCVCLRARAIACVRVCVWMHMVKSVARFRIMRRCRPPLAQARGCLVRRGRAPLSSTARAVDAGMLSIARAAVAFPV